MKRIITLLLIGIISLGMFATDLGSSTLTINANVIGKDPAYKMIASAKALELTGLTGNATTIYKTGDVYVAGTGISTNSSNKTDLTFYLGIAQTESRYSSNVTLSISFSQLVNEKAGTKDANGKEFKADPIPLPTVTASSTRSETIALKVGPLTKSNTEGTYTIDLGYSIFGYFMKDNTGLMVLKVVYEIPTAFSETTDTGYMPLGLYTGTITLTATSK